MTPKEKAKQTAVEWLQAEIDNKDMGEIPMWIYDFCQQAKEMEKQQMDKIAGDFWNEGASYMYDGTRNYESFEQYYNETYNIT